MSNYISSSTTLYRLDFPLQHNNHDDNVIFFFIHSFKVLSTNTNQILDWVTGQLDGSGLPAFNPLSVHTVREDRFVYTSHPLWPVCYMPYTTIISFSPPKMIIIDKKKKKLWKHE